MQPIVIIGAPRSGTNMLRDVLCRFENVATWPCDEINYIWRHGNVRFVSDEIPAELATPAVRSYIQNQFQWVSDRYGVDVIVEKTCSNSLRVPFVNTVLPEARYLFIRRDGLDAVGSAMKRWAAPLDIPYLLSKARFVPLFDLPFYAGRYLWNRIYRVLSKEQRLAFWGPHFAKMTHNLETHSLDEVCALQWQACVEKAAKAFDNMPADRWMEISYEQFVSHPKDELIRILKFVGLDEDESKINHAVEGVRADSVGKGRAMMEQADLSRLETLVAPTLARFGYL